MTTYVCLKYHSYQHFLSESPTAIRSIIVVVGGSLSIVFVPYSQCAVLFKSLLLFFSSFFLPGALTANKPLFSSPFLLFFGAGPLLSLLVARRPHRRLILS